MEILILKKIREGIKKEIEGYQGVVEFIEGFAFRQHPCLVFELLGANLYKDVIQNEGKKYKMEQMRSYIF